MVGSQKSCLQRALVDNSSTLTKLSAVTMACSFPTIRHNELRVITADMLSQVCHNVSTELHLHFISGEEMLVG